MYGSAPVSDRTWYVVVRRIAIFVSLISVIYFGMRVARNLPKQWRCDWVVYYKAGEAMRHREPLYTLEWGPDMTFKNAPCVALLVAPFTVLPPITARVLWFCADIGLWLILLSLCARLQWPGDRRVNLLAWPILLAVLMTVKFLIDQWHAGQSTMLYLTLTVASFYCVQRGRMLPAGVFLAAAVCVKLVPICFLPYFLLHRRGVFGLLAFVGSLLTLLILPAAWCGWEANAALLSQWPQHLLATDVPAQAFRIQNQSVYAALARLLTQSYLDCNIAAWDLQDVRRLWLAVSMISAGGLYLFLWRTRHSPSPHRASTHLALLMLFMTLYNPLGWSYNYVALFPTFLLLIETLRRPVRGRAWCLALFAIGFMMSSIEMRVRWLPFLDTLQVWNCRCVGGFILSALVIWSYWAFAALQTPDNPLRWAHLHRFINWASGSSANGTSKSASGVLDAVP